MLIKTSALYNTTKITVYNSNMNIKKNKNHKTQKQQK